MDKTLISGVIPRVLAIRAAAIRIAKNGYGTIGEWASELMDAARSSALPIHDYLNDEMQPYQSSTVKTVDVQKYLVEQHGVDLLTVKAAGLRAVAQDECPWWQKDHDPVAMAQRIHQEKKESGGWSLNQSGPRAGKLPLSRLSDRVAQEITQDDKKVALSKGRDPKSIGGRSVADFLKIHGFD